ncbi:DUF4429 domain-containing protein [Streptomyces sp. BI20]|uniref:DUF4429 domain-containing protein n=1 Tax=Streptomyces sp. BI20 TaxID=3403460 RepID=UPI003C76528F
MGDVLAGNHAVWEFDSETNSVLIRFERTPRLPALRGPRLWHALGPRRIPVSALADVHVAQGPGGKRDALTLRLLPRPGADPLTEVAAGQLREDTDPHRLTVPADRADLARVFAEDLRARLGPEAGEPAARFLVDPPPSSGELKGSDARIRFDGSQVTLRWSRTGASGTKWRAGDQVRALSELGGISWRSPELPDGHLRLIPRADDRAADPRPDHDLDSVLLGRGAVHESLPFAAALLHAVRERARLPDTNPAVPRPARRRVGDYDVPETLVGRGGPASGPAVDLTGGPEGPDAPDTEAAPYEDRVRHLGELHSAGLLTDEEYAALRDRFAVRP